MHVCLTRRLKTVLAKWVPFGVIGQRDVEYCTSDVAMAMWPPDHSNINEKTPLANDPRQGQTEP
jgi:hypothetical protein